MRVTRLVKRAQVLREGVVDSDCRSHASFWHHLPASRCTAGFERSRYRVSQLPAHPPVRPRCRGCPRLSSAD
jgi:hypothetical protein